MWINAILGICPVMLLWQYYISMGGGTKLVHCDLKGDTIISHSPLSLLFTLRKAVRLFSASALFWASSSNLRTKCNIFSNDRWQVDNSPPPQEYCLSQRLQEGISWQKAFWINLLICCVVKRIFGSAPTGISCSSSWLMWHLCSSIRSCTQKGYAHTHL